MTCAPLLVCGLKQDLAACDGRLRQARFGESLAEGGGRISARTHGESAGLWPLCVEIVHWAFGRSCHTLPALVLALLECIPPKVPVSMQTSPIVAHYCMESISHGAPGRSCLTPAPHGLESEILADHFCVPLAARSRWWASRSLDAQTKDGSSTGGVSQAEGRRGCVSDLMPNISLCGAETL